MLSEWFPTYQILSKQTSLFIKSINTSPLVGLKITSKTSSPSEHHLVGGERRISRLAGFKEARNKHLSTSYRINVLPSIENRTSSDLNESPVATNKCLLLLLSIMPLYLLASDTHSNYDNPLLTCVSVESSLQSNSPTPRFGMSSLAVPVVGI